MKQNHQKWIGFLLTVALVLSLSASALAASYSGDIVKPGLGGILPNDTITFPDNTAWATLTARWGVRVTFLDWDETVLQTEVIPVSDTEPGSTSAPADPVRDGWVFIGWERHDKNSGTAALRPDGIVTGVTGPGPIVFIAKYAESPSSLPMTGDHTRLLLLGTLLAASTAVLVCAVIRGKRKKD